MTVEEIHHVVTITEEVLVEDEKADSAEETKEAQAEEEKVVLVEEANLAHLTELQERKDVAKEDLLKEEVILLTELQETKDVRALSKEVLILLALQEKEDQEEANTLPYLMINGTTAHC